MPLHRLVGYVPAIATLVVAVLVYGAALPVLYTWPTLSGGRWAGAALLWLAALIAYGMAVGFAWRAFTRSLPTLVVLYGALDIYVALLHATASTGLALWAIDTAPARDTWITGVPPGTNAFEAFLGNFLFTAMTVINTAGFSHTLPRPGNILGGLWGLSVSGTGFLWLTLFITIALGEIKRAGATKFGKMRHAQQQNVKHEVVHSWVPEVIVRNRRRARLSSPQSTYYFKAPPQ